MKSEDPPAEIKVKGSPAPQTQSEKFRAVFFTIFLSWNVRCQHWAAVSCHHVCGVMSSLVCLCGPLRPAGLLYRVHPRHAGFKLSSTGAKI